MHTSNPVVLLSNGVWHIVEPSRQSERALCGRLLQHRQAHTRLGQVTAEKACPACVTVWRQQNQPRP